VTERGSVAFGGSQVAYSVVRSTRRQKTVEITVARAGEVVVAAPVRTPVEKLEAIVKRRAPWILRHGGFADPGAAMRCFVSGESLPYLGRRVRMLVRQTLEDGVDVHFQHWQFDVRVSRGLIGDARSQAVRTAFVHWYRQRATERVTERVARFATLLGLAPTRVLVRDQRHRWGSCSPDGVLRFNWRIVMAPPALVDYVVIHELAHLQVRTHRPAYWALVARAAADYRERRERLRTLGPTFDI
jgi:predicted metal-dependent hydrolase